MDEEIDIKELKQKVETLQKSLFDISITNANLTVELVEGWVRSQRIAFAWNLGITSALVFLLIKSF